MRNTLLMLTSLLLLTGCLSVKKVYSLQDRGGVLSMRLILKDHLQVIWLSIMKMDKSSQKGTIRMDN